MLEYMVLTKCCVVLLPSDFRKFYSQHVMETIFSSIYDGSICSLHWMFLLLTSPQESKQNARSSHLRSVIASWSMAGSFHYLLAQQPLYSPCLQLLLSPLHVCHLAHIILQTLTVPIDALQCSRTDCRNGCCLLSSTFLTSLNAFSDPQL